MTEWIIALFVVVLLFVWLKKNMSANASLVVTGPGVLKTHDVECKFRSDEGYHGKLSQSRWSDGQERFRLSLRKLPGGYTGPLSLIYQGERVAEFEVKSGILAFAVKGIADDSKPKFEIGEEVRLEFGSQMLTGVVEAD